MLMRIVHVGVVLIAVLIAGALSGWMTIHGLFFLLEHVFNNNPSNEMPGIGWIGLLCGVPTVAMIVGGFSGLFAHAFMVHLRNADSEDEDEENLQREVND